MKIRNDCITVNVDANDDANDRGDSDNGRLLFLSEKHLIRRPSDEPDLRIYHHDIVGGISSIGNSGAGNGNSMNSTASQKPFSLLGSSSCTTTMTIASGKTLPSHRFKNYELSSTSSSSLSPSASSMVMPSTTTIATKHNNYPFYSSSNGTTACSTLVMTSQAQAVATMQSNLKSMTETSISNASTANCKPRQSIVRTSPSFSFLSTGYHQQQDNFLWCSIDASILLLLVLQHITTNAHRQNKKPSENVSNNIMCCACTTTTHIYVNQFPVVHGPCQMQTLIC